MKKQKLEKGITLIALIITIVVLLIIAVVAVGAVKENDIIAHAQNTKSEYIIAQEQEQIGLALSNWQVKSMVSKNKITFKSAMGTALQQQNVTINGEEEGPLCILFNETQHGYTVESNGSIVSGKVDVEPVKFNWNSVNLNNLDLNAAYKGSISAFNLDVIISFTESGKIIIEEGGNITEIDAKDSRNIDEATGNLSFLMEISGMSSNIFVTMNGTDVDAQITVPGVGTLNITYVKSQEIYSHKSVLERSGISNNAGTYNGTWTVIGTESGKTKLVSTSSVTIYKLGYEDRRATDPNVEGSLKEGASGLDKAVWSYKNVETTLDAVAKEVTGIESARSINVEDIETLAEIQDSDKGEDYNKQHSYNAPRLKEYGLGEFFGDTLRVNHTYYSYQLTKEKVGMLASGNYWLASKCINCYRQEGSSITHANFSIRRVTVEGKIISKALFNESGEIYTNEYAIRAIVYI